MNGIKVVKFGGSCLSSPENILLAAKKILEEVHRKRKVIVVVSALSGVTNQLLYDSNKSTSESISKEDLDKQLDTIESLFETERRKTFMAVPPAIMKDIDYMRKKSQKLGLNLFDVMEDFVAKLKPKEGEKEEEMAHKERARLLKAIGENVPKTAIIKKVEEEKTTNEILEDLQLLKELKQEISNDEIWNQLKDVLKLTEEGSTERAQIMNLVKGIMAGKSREIEQKKIPDEF